MTDEQRQAIYDGALYAHLQSNRGDYAVAWACWVAGMRGVPFFDALDVTREALKESRALIRSGRKVGERMQELRRKYDQ